MEPQEKKPKGSVMGIFKSPYARHFLGKYKWSYLVGILILIVIDLVQTDVPLIMGDSINIIDEVILGTGTLADPMGEITRQVLRLAGIAALVFVGRIGWRWFIFGSARKIERDMRNDLYSHLQTLSASFFQEHKAGEVMAYMTSDIETVRMVFAVTVMMGLDTLVIGVSTLYKMITRIDLRLSIVAFIPMILVAVTTTILGNEMHRRFTRKQEAFSDLSDFVQEKLGGIKVIKAFVQEQKEWAAFEKVNQDTKQANIREAKLQAFMWPFMRMVAGISMALAVAYGGYIAILGRIDAGQFSSFIMFLNSLVWPMAAIGRIINIMTRGSASMTRLETILNAETDICDGPQAVSLGTPEGTVEARHLTFTYPGGDKPVLENVSFRLEKGQTLGIVGRTGSGKTTLVNLLMRVFDPVEDMLYVGGREIHTIPLHDLRAACGYVPQDNFLFSDTVAANIAFGDRTKTQADVEEAAKQACVHDNIIDFPQGYETMVGERGVSLSGGQKQRIAIARALILDPEILILDDSVSAVDTDTEEKILQHLREHRKGKTNIIVAHRISTLQDADQIIVIDEGRIAERGNHESLLAQGGIYADLYHRQLLEKMKKEEYAL